ncbi:universal stress protein [Hymenobacter sp.]|uniref:universal stress protein n=1 Tax=Hymenobacter sp. TaxID=1898978 RepID=UPI00286CC0E9|nr:universal stress protein [Hymenobacter sp.]
MKTILVPLDHTAAAEPTLAYANKLAVRWPAEVVLLYCLPTAPGEAAAALAAAEQRLRGLVERLRYQQLTRQNGRRIRYRYRVLAGCLPDHVHAEAAACAADLVVLGLAHIDCCRAAAPDNHAVTLAALVACPVLVVPAGRRALPHRLVFSADFTDVAPGLLPQLAALADAFPAPLDLVQVYAPADRPKRRQLQQALSTAAAQLAWPGPVAQHLLEDEARLEGIDDFCARTQAELLVIAPASAGQLVQYFGTCYTKTRAYHTQIPVLILPALRPETAPETCCAHCAQHPVRPVPNAAAVAYHTLNWV